MILLTYTDYRILYQKSWGGKVRKHEKGLLFYQIIKNIDRSLSRTAFGPKNNKN